MKLTKEMIYPRHRAARKSVSIVRKYFRSLGFVLTDRKHITANGSDLYVIKGKNAFSIEIKTATKSSRAWKVNKVSRINDDYIAIVFPSGEIHIDTMKTHLSLCSKYGDRCITALGKIYE